jgi:threonyl-tRNA synthetase/REP element-mobilizing transposase RayT
MAEERKTLEQRHQMSDLERLRHSAAHVLATAIARLWPEAQFAAGPPVETGFYYDVQLSHRISPEDFPKIEEEMKKEIKANHTFERVQVSRDEALAAAQSGRLAALADRGTPSVFKLDIIQGIPEGEPITFYKNGDFIDLCAGPHVMRTGNIGAYKLTSVASAYYKGDEKNPQLQRIYGTAFKNKTEMEAYFTMLEEAKKRDHRKIGKEMELFCFDDDVGPGLAMWLPRGTVLIEELEKLAKETEFAAGYQRVRTPHLARENMYLTSGHLPYYADSMFPPMTLHEGASAKPGEGSGASGRAGVPPAPAGILPASNIGQGGAHYSKRRRLPHFEKPWAIYFVTFTTLDRRVLSPETRTVVLDALRHFHGKRYELFAAVVMPNHVHALFQPWPKDQDEKGDTVFWSLADLMHSIKSFSAKEINKFEGTHGSVWAEERHDRYVRGDADLQEKFDYICDNPYLANLETPEKGYEWLWTSDYDSSEAGKMPAGAGGTPALPGAPEGSPSANQPERPAGDRYYLKAMNCPHHHKLFGAVPRSYRDLPLRLAEYGTCYRYEQSGELMGLMRVRAMQMNDAHIYCTEEQFEDEFRAVNEMYLKYFKIFGLEKYQMRFSTHDPAKLGQKFVDQSELWLKTEDMVRGVLQRSNINYVEVPNEAAFYGPKIDVQVWSAIGREFTIATNQVDFAVPAKFGLVYKTRENAEATPLCIHRAPLGTHERFIGFLIEHYAGNFPLWLAPEQVRVLPMAWDGEPDAEALLAYSRALVAELRSHGVRADLDASHDPIKAKIANAEERKIHTMLVIGKRDLEANAVSVRVHGKGNLGAKPRDEVVADLLAAIKERRA